ncbi:hypothetical protein [Streptococcus didelphis]|nr:hypothetical protein [Streptococcus didelphis]
MKILLNKEDINRFNKDGIKLTIAFIILAISVYPLFYFLSWIGVGIWFLEWLLTMFLALKIKKVKKEYNLKTYRHIVAFSNGKTLDKIQEIEEKAKYPYQKPVIVIGFTIIFTLIVFAVALFIDSFNH